MLSFVYNISKFSLETHKTLHPTNLYCNRKVLFINLCVTEILNHRRNTGYHLKSGCPHNYAGADETR